MADLEERVRDLERIVNQLTELAQVQAAQIDRLREELSWEITTRAIDGMGPQAGRYVLVPR